MKKDLLTHPGRSLSISTPPCERLEHALHVDWVFRARLAEQSTVAVGVVFRLRQNATHLVDMGLLLERSTLLLLGQRIFALSFCGVEVICSGRQRCSRLGVGLLRGVKLGLHFGGLELLRGQGEGCGDERRLRRGGRVVDSHRGSP
ncbi:hypothetical protein [Microbacterium sp.]|uniref:hypothetical protein n=1 Tax=Microbacterium sp. TaxID=51671 RepID=UPI0035682320